MPLAWGIYCTREVPFLIEYQQITRDMLWVTVKMKVYPTRLSSSRSGRPLWVTVKMKVYPTTEPQEWAHAELWVTVKMKVYPTDCTYSPRPVRLWVTEYTAEPTPLYTFHVNLLSCGDLLFISEYRGGFCEHYICQYVSRFVCFVLARRNAGTGTCFNSLIGPRTA